MKKAAFILVMSSTAFAATTPESVRPTNVQSRTGVSSQQVSDAQPTETNEQTTVNAATAAYVNALAKRRPKASLTANIPSDPGIHAPKFGDWELKAQLRNDLTLARVSELQMIGGKNFGLVNEVRVGLKHKSGYGFMLTGAYATNNYADTAGNAGTSKDSSVMLIHPSLVKTNTFDLYGHLRIYVPTSETSREQDIHSAAYSSYLDITLPHKFTMTNLLISRVFTQPNPAATDSNSLFYNSLELYHQTTTGVAFAFGGQVEADNKYHAPTGTEVDIYPFIDFTIIPNVLIEPKYIFPVFISGDGIGGATGAGFDQSQAELFIKIAI